MKPAGRTSYRVLERCVVGSLRNPGEVFEWETFAKCPRYLAEVKALDAPPETKVRKGSKVLPEDLGIGTPKPSQNVTSADMITE